jgi:uncharacterized protein YcbK (DUF882 family)
MVKTYSVKRDGATKLSAHFAVREFASPDTDVVMIDTDLVDVLERLYERLRCSKIIITSGYRTSDYDKAVGGNGSGYHTKGRAADINCWHVVDGKEVRLHGSVICCALQDLGWQHGVGWIAGCAVHVDTRTARYWFDEQQGCRSVGDDWYAYMAGKGYVVGPALIDGDVNGDGTLDSSDARVALQAAVGKVTLTDEQQAAADVTGDGKVDSADAREILQKGVGK